MQLDLIVGTRPNFMKVAPIIDAINRANSKGNKIQFRLIHTGQHYDPNMSGSFFQQLGIPQPDVNFDAGGGTQAAQTGKIMLKYEELLGKETSDICIVVGDVTSTMACSIVAKKAHLKVAHVEAGIRSQDLSMPEEINRMVTDSITDLFFTTSETANENLRQLGVAQEKIFFVGNTMIDTLLKHRPKFIQPPIWKDLDLAEKEYAVITLHRPANVDASIQLKQMIDAILENSRGLTLVFPVHPRTRNTLNELNIAHSRLHLIDPLSYLEFNYLVEKSKVVITDSGGITEETTVMGIPCMTLRDNTERPETITMGTNELLGTNPDSIPPAFEKLFANKWKIGNVPPLWDGKAAERIINHLLSL